MHPEQATWEHDGGISGNLLIDRADNLWFFAFIIGRINDLRKVCGRMDDVQRHSGLLADVGHLRAELAKAKTGQTRFLKWRLGVGTLKEGYFDRGRGLMCFN
ncbi:hypothetical protein PC116_g22211 [Phytophthora cactorum]|nr:hypothetical protein C6341_g19441 [Phytophthora cactorum]KAG4229468.1 hypothetical protein PC116_g22211 [Phytophthora cactorum]